MPSTESGLGLAIRQSDKIDRIARKSLFYWNWQISDGRSQQIAVLFPERGSDVKNAWSCFNGGAKAPRLAQDNDSCHQNPI
jgi:hypothetical protein